jgi:hypothetical protein
MKYAKPADDAKSIIDIPVFYCSLKYVLLELQFVGYKTSQGERSNPLSSIAIFKKYQPMANGSS